MQSDMIRIFFDEPEVVGMSASSRLSQIHYMKVFQSLEFKPIDDKFPNILFETDWKALFWVK